MKKTPKNKIKITKPDRLQYYSTRGRRDCGKSHINSLLCCLFHHCVNSTNVPHTRIAVHLQHPAALSQQMLNSAKVLARHMLGVLCKAGPDKAPEVGLGLSRLVGNLANAGAVKVED